MRKRVIGISTPGSHLFIKNSQLMIDWPKQERVQVPLEDLGVLVLEDGQALLTQAVLTGLLAAGACLVVCDYYHLPTGLLLPLSQRHDIVERHQAQVQAPQPLKKRLWQQIIQAKIRQQGVMLGHFTGDNHGFELMAQKVRSGDPDNVEGQAAQRYWPLLFGKSFRRDRELPGINVLLNYGYTVIRAAVARALVASGLIATLGLFHKNRSNPFCLADDLLEPFRPYVDWRVKNLVMETPDMNPPEITEKATKKVLLSLFNEGIKMGGKSWPLLYAIELSANSLAQALTEKEVKLLLPTGLPLGQDEAE